MSKKLTVLYQGDCTFCRWCVDLVLRNSNPGVCTFMALNSEEGRALVSKLQLHVDPSHPNSIVVLEEGSVPLYKWNAGVRIAKAARFPFKFIYYPAAVVPAIIGDAIYNWVGRHRDLLCKITLCNKKIRRGL